MGMCLQLRPVFLFTALFFTAIVLSGCFHFQENVLDDIEKKASASPVLSNINISDEPSADADLDTLTITDTLVGSGTEAKNENIVTVHYTGVLKNGTKFDSSYDRNQPYAFVLGAGQVIRGWDLGLLGMKQGGKRRLVIPPDLAYGHNAIGSIPAESTLIFDIELLKVEVSKNMESAQDQNSEDKKEESPAIEEKKTTATDQKENTTMLKISGKVLAGTKSFLVDFNMKDYGAALQTDKLVVLYFYATWCPICKEEIKNLYEAFHAIKDDAVVGFRVNYNDKETDKDEEALAREHGVAYQHTKVFIKNNKRILKSPEGWNTARYNSEIHNALTVQ